MWRFVSRSIRNTFRRHRNTLYNSRLSRNKYAMKNVKSRAETRKFLTPNVVSFDKSGFGSTKDNKTRGEDDSNWESRHIWQGAVRWSGAIAIGWIVSQSLFVRKTLDEFWSKSTAQIPVDYSLSNLINEFKKIEPRKMLSLTQIAQFNEQGRQEENIPIVFGSINYEEFDMLLHRQQSF